MVVTSKLENVPVRTVSLVPNVTNVQRVSLTFLTVLVSFDYQIVQSTRFQEKMFLACDCKPGTSASNVCDSEGKCRCNETYSGDKCSECSPGYFGYPSCQRKFC